MYVCIMRHLCPELQPRTSVDQHYVGYCESKISYSTFVYYSERWQPLTDFQNPFTTELSSKRNMLRILNYISQQIINMSPR